MTDLDLAAIEARCAHVPREHPLMGFGDVLFALLQATASDALHLVAEVRALAESDAEHVAMMQAEHDRRVEAEAEVRRLQGALRNLKRNALMCGALAGLDIPAWVDNIPTWVDNLLAGREWNGRGCEGVE